LEVDFFTAAAKSSIEEDFYRAAAACEFIPCFDYNIAPYRTIEGIDQSIREGKSSHWFLL